MAIGFNNGTLKIYEFDASKVRGLMLSNNTGESNLLIELIATRESRDAVTHVKPHTV